MDDYTQTQDHIYPCLVLQISSIKSIVQYTKTPVIILGLSDSPSLLILLLNNSRSLDSPLLNKLQAFTTLKTQNS